MRLFRAEIVLIAAGVGLAACAGWFATVLPLRSEVLTLGGSWGSQTTRMNLWGQPLSATLELHSDHPAVEKKDIIQEGPLRGVARHGRWLVRRRDGDGPWISEVEWYIDDRQVSQEEWERRR